MFIEAIVESEIILGNEITRCKEGDEKPSELLGVTLREGRGELEMGVVLELDLVVVSEEVFPRRNGEFVLDKSWLIASKTSIGGIEGTGSKKNGLALDWKCLLEENVWSGSLSVSGCLGLSVISSFDDFNVGFEARVFWKIFGIVKLTAGFLQEGTIISSLGDASG